MFDDKENIIGVLLLGLCTIVGGVLVWQIVTGERIHYDGPAWLGWTLLVLFIGASVFGLSRGGIFRRWSGRQWPDPMTGQSTQRPWWKRLFGGQDDQAGGHS
jgi:hypothetical protein